MQFDIVTRSGRRSQKGRADPGEIVNVRILDGVTLYTIRFDDGTPDQNDVKYEELIFID